MGRMSGCLTGSALVQIGLLVRELSTRTGDVRCAAAWWTTHGRLHGCLQPQCYTSSTRLVHKLTAGNKAATIAKQYTGCPTTTIPCSLCHPPGPLLTSS